MSAHAVPRLTPEEYLKIDREAEIRSEYHDGQMFAMSGGTLPHSLLAMQLQSAIMLALRGRGCRVTNSDLRVGITAQGPFVYPDAAIYCGEPRLADNYHDTLLNPTIVFEVLSKSSEAYDRGNKFAHYRRIDSLREYVLISHTEPRVEIFAKGPDGKWTLTACLGEAATFELTSIDVEIALADIYRDITLEGA